MSEIQVVRTPSVSEIQRTQRAAQVKGTERDVSAGIQQEAHTQYLEQMVQVCRCYYLVHLHESSRRAVFSMASMMASMSGVTVLVLLAFMFFYYLVCACLPTTSNAAGVTENR